MTNDQNLHEVVPDQDHSYSHGTRWSAGRQAIEILSRISDCFIALDSDWRFAYLNPRAELHLGRTLDALKGRSIWNEFPQLAGSQFEERFREAIASGNEALFEIRSVLHPGRWLSTHLVPSHEGLEIYLHDITEKRNALDALSSSEERLRLITDSLPFLISFVDSEERYQFINLAYEQWFGMPQREIIGRPLRDVIGEDAYKQVAPLVRRALNGERVSFETVLDYRHAGTRDVSGTYVPCYDSSGQIEGFTALIADISERKKIEEERRSVESALRASDKRFQLMADSAPVLIWISDTENQGIWFNKPWLDFTGRRMEQELGAGWADGVHPDDLQRCVEYCFSNFNARRPFTMEFRFRRSDGEYRWMLDTGIPIYGDDGEFSGYVGSCIDITDRKLAEEERTLLLESERTARSEAERASRIKDEFLATLSHELRTPLNAIFGWAQLLRSRELAADEMVQGLEVIERNARVQTQIVEDLLDMSRIISGKIRIDVHPVDPQSVIDAAMETVRPAADAKGIRLQQIVGSITGPIMGDANRLQQIVWNLLSNAIKFTPSGGSVQVRLEQVSSNIEISVADTGQGIKPEFLPHVFERFRQADSSTTRTYGGLGLGLAIVKNLVELHGGTIRAMSPGEGEGSTFIVTLPMGAARSDEKDPSQSHSATAESPALREPEHPSLAGMTIVVVDDEPDARDLLKRILEEADATIITAASAREGLQAVKTHRPEVLVSDIGMPGEDGFDLIRSLREMGVDEGGNTPAIALTAFARSEDRQRVLLSGFQMHMAKPVEPSSLIAAIVGVSGRGEGI